MALLIDAIGWVGSALLLSAYLLTSSGNLSGDSLRYQAMNFLGGAAAAANVLWYGALPVAMFEISWSLIGLVALVRIIARQASDRSRPKTK